ncbi:hypothetical protein EON63_21810 [archaeon]|nr:MAG: hypothetical protein EON63_21810 [archaeon]
MSSNHQVCILCVGDGGDITYICIYTQYPFAYNMYTNSTIVHLRVCAMYFPNPLHIVIPIPPYYSGICMWESERRCLI